MRLLIPPPLHSYTGGVSEAQATAATLSAALAQLDALYPGIRFRIVDEQDRIRPHIRIFVDGQLAASLQQSLSGKNDVQIVCALSGG